MRKSFTAFSLALVLVSCGPNDPIEELERDPNGLYTPYLISERSDGAVTLSWGRPACLYCGTCSCPQLSPDHFEILYSDSDTSALTSYSVFGANLYDFEFTIDNLENGKPYYFAIKAILSGRRYTRSRIVMTIPGPSENVLPALEQVGNDVYQGAWSPDQEAVAYISDHSWNEGKNSARSLFYSSPEAGTGHLVEINASNPAWSPAGDAIAYQTSHGEIAMTPGYLPTHLALYHIADDESSRLTEGNSVNFRPSWSPDGNWIAFLSDRAKGNEYNIWKVSSEGGDPVQLTSDFGDRDHLGIIDDRSPGSLSWSHDGKNIAFERLAPLAHGYKSAIYTISSDGGGTPVALINSSWNDVRPTYSPDGNSIAFLSDRSGSYEIWTMNLQTRTLKQLTGRRGTNPAANSGIEWSADGERMLFTTNNALYYLDAE